MIYKIILKKKNKWTTYKETDTNMKTRVEYIKNFHNPINHFLGNRLTPILNYVNNSEMTLFKDKINWKLPNSKGFRPHQDQPARSDFSNNKFTTVALFTDNSTIENGCI
jgi:2-aminoethylphosphonate dioxygenase